MEIKDLSTSALLENLAEECAELAHAALKEARRLRGENPTPATAEECQKALTEESADVVGMLGVVTELKIINEDEMLRCMTRKMIRFMERLEKA